MSQVSKQPSGGRALRYFQAVARFGSIRKAAAALNIASSAVNRRMLELESELGVPLFERLPRGVRLTSAGELLLQHARRTAQDFELVRSRIEELRGLRRGHVRLAVIEAVASTVAAQVATFQRGHPRVSFEVTMTGSQDVVAAVVRETADIGYAFNPPADRRFSVVAEAPRALQALVGRDHPLAGHDRLRLSDCLSYPILMGDETLGGRLLLDAASDTASLSLRAATTSNSIAVLQAIAARSQAVCFQIEGDGPPPPGIQAIPLTDRTLRGRLVLGVGRNRMLPVAVAVFLEQLKTDLQSS